LNINDNGKLLVFNSVNDSLYIPEGLRICADEIDLDRIVPKLEASELMNYSVSSFCLLNREEGYFALVGTVKLDVENDGCDADDINVGNAKFYLEGEGAGGYYLTDSEGNVRMNFYKVSIEPLLKQELETILRCYQKVLIFNFQMMVLQPIKISVFRKQQKVSTTYKCTYQAMVFLDRALMKRLW